MNDRMDMDVDFIFYLDSFLPQAHRWSGGGLY